MLISTYTHLGKLYLKQNKFDLAEQMLKKAISITKSDILRYSQAQMILGDCLAKQKNFEQAIQYYEDAFSKLQDRGLAVYERKLLVRICRYWRTRNSMKYRTYVDLLFETDLKLDGYEYDFRIELEGGHIDDSLQTL